MIALVWNRGTRLASVDILRGGILPGKDRFTAADNSGLAVEVIVTYSRGFDRCGSCILCYFQ